MTSTYQPSMFDLPGDAWGDPVSGVGELAGRVTRHQLTAGAWVDVLPGWLHGSDAVFETLLGIDWRVDRRQMYDNVVDVPRLLRWYGGDEELPHQALVAAKQTLNSYYADELGEEFVTAGMCLYRDGRDSVAWHGDTIGRSARHDTMVAIVSLGSPRNLSLRPRAGNHETLRFPLGHGDLIVMGGSCQRTWEHAILKTAKAVGPRISVQFRPVDVA
ncbi:alpha-ketoglutarate-dependent dioxygenase AlkB [Paractinoplanes brasiliensis]|uniref:Alkylated DNA repair dioxygenase AlkB n=1 Tax=Paractinoplanes brasiliensis TaxID=52695 RepID=A0A4R6JUA9_9ACTN|nr:alpha-ketoglutarate-dependent dioxygenase AlkB [Actinoplanes brasiliensis]TDO40290.1 alkylated DNA repair dioxygenase AlkB [Actinoplanes brasiliensis]GID25353.1 alkylated DNA repair protein [Actinoplanes brasiliensis]